MLLAQILMVSGLATLVSGWYLRLQEGWLASALNGPGATVALAVGLLAVTLCGWTIPLRGVADLRRIAVAPSTEIIAAGAIRERIDYPRWQAFGILGTVAASGFVFGLNILW